MPKGSSVEWFYRHDMDCWIFIFKKTKKKIAISGETMLDYKGSMGDLVNCIIKTDKITLIEAEDLYAILHYEQKKVLHSYAYGSYIKDSDVALLPPVSPRPRRTLYFVDLGNGMLVPKAFVEDFISWEKTKVYGDPYTSDSLGDLTDWIMAEFKKLSGPSILPKAGIYLSYPKLDT